jgi:sugar O-acyltransferase (sialic acid O-acetyltransferase NeuD family)
MAKIIVFGVGQFADMAHFYLTHDSPHEVVAFTVDNEYLKEKEYRGLPVYPFENIEERLPPGDFEMFVPVSYKKVNKIRAEKYHQAKAKGYKLISYVCSKATIWPGQVIGDNCFIFENNVIQPYVEIGNNVIMWSGNHIGHHTMIKDHCFLASHVVISGSVVIEPYCFFGVNSTIRDNITIASECVIGAGALILKSTKEKGVYIGRPAEIVPKSSDELKNI